MRYRRACVPGGTWFFTVNLADRSSRLLVEQVDPLRHVVREVKRRHPFEIVAWVVLPEHIHAVWIRHVHYGHINPVKHGGMVNESDWWWSSIHS